MMKKRYIGEIARELKIHEQTIRDYERKGLISPQRTPKNIRYFSQNDVNRLMIIITLTNELRINISGVKLIFSLADRLGINDDELLDYIHDHINEYIDYK